MKAAFIKPDCGRGKFLAVVFAVLLTLVSPLMVGCEPEVQLVLQDGLQSGLISLTTAFIDAIFLGIEMNTIEGATTTTTGT